MQATDDEFPMHPMAYPVIPDARGIPFLIGRQNLIAAALLRDDVETASYIADRILDGM